MNEANWSRFFELMDKVVNLPGLSAGEKVEEVRKQAAKHGAETTLAEFASWDLDLGDE